jgi:extracellular elastinolytic metalloproteinase
MTRLGSFWRTGRTTVFLILGLLLAQFTFFVPTQAQLPLGDPSLAAFRFQEQVLANLDARIDSVAPDASQLNVVNGLNATARWNKFGSPRSLISYGDFLSPVLPGEPANAVRDWIRSNAALFKLRDSDVSDLELLHDVVLPGSEARALLFRQRFDGLPAASDGLIAIGYAAGRVAYVSASTAAWDGQALGAPVLSPLAAWQRAAADIGRTIPLSDIADIGLDGDWSLLNVAGFAQTQRARLRALPTPTQGVRLVYETIALHSAGGEALAYTHMVDALNGDVLLRRTRLEHLDGDAHTARATVLAPASTSFTGTFGQSTCANPHSFVVGAGQTSLVVLVNATLPSNDIKIELRDSSGAVASSDTATSPEGLVYQPTGGVPAGNYSVVVCPFDASSIEPRSYNGLFVTDDTVLPGTSLYPPRWKFFQANPPLNGSGADTRIVACWEARVDGIDVPGCDIELQGPDGQPIWDVNARTGTPTFTTIGNNAQTAQSWYSPLTPSLPYRPLSPARDYSYPFTNAWQNSKCSPTNFLLPNGNDTDAATANLFAMHNRMHDWSYRLGFREETYNLQESNRGNAAGAALENDPEIGNVQAGAVTGGFPQYLGRDNANQITLNDGIAPITNMYLWQPLAGAFYPPCVDGDYDMSVIAHEYGHAIQNRMVAGPDEGLSSSQGRSMGESWSDLTAIEFLNEYGLVPVADENPFAVGAFVTGAKQSGIRNYGMNNSPLNFSNIEYDGNGTASPHADGEIWSAVNFDIRQALIAKYNSQYPADNKALQQACAEGEISVHNCPGNRRWAQIFHDAFLLMGSGVSMDDARDAYLAVDQMRSAATPNNAWPTNQSELWRMFARRGLGIGAESSSGEDRDPAVSFVSPLENPANVTFNFTASDEGNAAVVGDYEARAVPVADTDPSTPLGATARFAAGRYTFTIVAPGYGVSRIPNRSFSAGQNQTINLGLRTNYASGNKGATASGPGVNHAALIDDTEATNYANLNTLDIRTTNVTVDLAGGARTIRHIRVSAALRPENANDTGGDTGAQNRFTALRQFEIWACNANDPLKLNCIADGSFSKVFTSPADAFPSDVPRPTAPTLRYRAFDIPATTATHFQIRVVSNQCTGGPAYQGEQDNDPLDATDCDSGTVGGMASTAGRTVRIAELQLFAQRPGW